MLSERDLLDHVLQFRVTLREITPPIWRRIQIPATFTFWDLHVAIQDAMGWSETHLHEFQVGDPTGRGKELVIIGPIDDSAPIEMRSDRETLVAPYFPRPKSKARYYYDYGDDWRHDVVLEKALVRNPASDYPVCLAGRRACPPEDCGGPPGYSRLLEVLADPYDEEHEDLLAWVGGEFDAEKFDPASVVFDDPEARWRQRMGPAGHEP